MKKTLFALLGLVIGASTSSEGQESATASPPGFGVQSSAARNKKLQEQELQAAIQKARELKALQYSTAAQPMAPIPWGPEMEAETEIERAASAAEYQPVPQAPSPPSSPNSAAVEQALAQATGDTDVEMPLDKKSGSPLLRMLRKKYEKIPDSPSFDAPTGTARPAPSPYNNVEMVAPTPAEAAPARSNDSIFLNRGGGDASASTGSVKYETEVDVNGVDVVLPQGSTVSIIAERDGFARVRIPDGRVGIVHRSAIE